MAKYRVTGPDGQQYEITAPDDATPEQVRDYVRQQVDGEKEPTEDHQGEEAAFPKDEAHTRVEDYYGDMPEWQRKTDAFARGATGAIPFANDALALADAALGRGRGESFGERRQDNLKTRRAQSEVQMRERPGTSVAGLLAGAAVLPVGRKNAGVTLAQKIRSGAKIGGGYGALHGLGQGDTAEERFKAGVTGGALGAGAGAAVAPAAAAVARVARPVVRTLRGVANPDAEASRRVFATVEKAVREGRSLTPDEMATALRTNAPLVLGDMAGEPGRALARSAANTSPEGREVLAETVQGRFAEQSTRTAGFIRQLVGGHFNPAEFTRRLQQRARAVNRPLYEQAEREAAHAAAAMPDGLWNAELAELAQSPSFARAMIDSVPHGADRAVAHGGRPSKAPFVTDEAGNLTLAPANAAGERALPNLQFWDNVKRELDAKIIGLRQSGYRAQAGTLADLRKKLLAVLDGVAPTYSKARASAASFFGAEDALEAGSNFVAMSKSADLAKARVALAKMSPAERTLFAQGYAAELAAAAERVGDNANVPTRALFNNPLSRQKTDLALGPQRARELQSFLGLERTMDRLRTALGNSTTARQLAESGLAGGLAGWYATSDMMQGGGGGATAGIIVRLLAGKVDQRVARRVAELLASNDPRALAQASQIIAGNRTIASAIDRLDQALATIGGTAAGTAQ